ncbi:hypothetical protein DFQ13_102644 [Actinokineospora spheciospongiae]|nr:hypothetical protein DFQ13_102644 [Actinokineospora spheciospongiae]
MLCRLPRTVTANPVPRFLLDELGCSRCLSESACRAFEPKTLCGGGWVGRSARSCFKGPGFLGAGPGGWICLGGAPTAIMCPVRPSEAERVPHSPGRLAHDRLPHPSTSTHPGRAVAGPPLRWVAGFRCARWGCWWRAAWPVVGGVVTAALVGRWWLAAGLAVGGVVGGCARWVRCGGSLGWRLVGGRRLCRWGSAWWAAGFGAVGGSAWWDFGWLIARPAVGGVVGRCTRWVWAAGDSACGGVVGGDRASWWPGRWFVGGWLLRQRRSG